MNLEVSVFRHLRRKEREDLTAAIRDDKYWKATSSNKDFVYVVALTRARVKSREGFSARATFVGRAFLADEAAKFCRKYRVLLVERRTGRAFCVLTWRAFLRVMKGYSEDVYRTLIGGELPPYLNTKILESVLEEKRKHGP